MSEIASFPYGVCVCIYIHMYIHMYTHIYTNIYIIYLSTYFQILKNTHVDELSYVLCCIYTRVFR